MTKADDISHDFFVTITGTGITDLLSYAELDKKFCKVAKDIFEAGGDDATVSYRHGEVIVSFTREAPTFAKALETAFATIRAAGYESKSVGVHS